MVGRICIAIDSLALLGLFGGRRRGRIALEELLARNAFFSGIAFVTSNFVTFGLCAVIYKINITSSSKESSSDSVSVYNVSPSDSDYSAGLRVDIHILYSYKH